MYENKLKKLTIGKIMSKYAKSVKSVPKNTIWEVLKFVKKKKPQDFRLGDGLWKGARATPGCSEMTPPGFLPNIHLINNRKV